MARIGFRRCSPSTTACCPAGRWRDVPGRRTASRPTSPTRGWADGRASTPPRRSSRRAACSLMLDFVPNHTGLRPRLDPDRIPSSSCRARSTTTAPSRTCTIRSRMPAATTVRFIACGRDPFFPPWRDVAQLNYFNPGDARGDDRRPDHHRAALRRRALRHGDAGAERRLRADVGSSASICCGTQPASEFWPEATRARADDLPRRGLLGPRVSAAAAGVRLHLRQAAARSAAPRQPARGARPPAGRSRLQREAGAVPREPRRGAERAPSSAIASAPPRPSPSRCRGCASSSTDSSKGRHRARRCSSDAGRTEAGPSRHPRLLRAAAEGDRQTALPRGRAGRCSTSERGDNQRRSDRVRLATWARTSPSSSPTSPATKRAGLVDGRRPAGG